MLKLLLAALLCISSACSSVNSVPTQEEADMNAILLSWAVTLSGLPAPSVKPIVEYKPQEFFEKNACGGRACKVWGWYPNTGGNVVYVHEDVRKILFDGSNPQSLLAASIIVHEEVHYLQAVKRNFAKYDCKDAIMLEREAYGVQREYLLHYGRYYTIGISMHNSGCEDSE